jgi:tetratricopeptide (TPR) repeat protein
VTANEAEAAERKASVRRADVYKNKMRDASSRPLRPLRGESSAAPKRYAKPASVPLRGSNPEPKKPSAQDKPAPSRPSYNNQTVYAPNSSTASAIERQKRNAAGTAAAAEPAPRPTVSFNFLRLLIIAFTAVSMLTAAAYYILSRTEQGQVLLATYGRVASSDAYSKLGMSQLSQGYILSAVETLEIAHSLNPTDLQVLLTLGDAYSSSDKLDRADLAFRRAISLYPQNSVAYRRLIRLYEEQERAWEAMEMMKLAYAATADEAFNQMLVEARPNYPRVSVVGGPYAEAFPLHLYVNDPEEKVYYTLDGSDPYFGTLYTEPIWLDESDDPYYLRAVSILNGRMSEEQKQTYTVHFAAPAMPKPNLGPATYSSVRTVGLRAEKDVVEIRYTTDGTQATVNSKLYTAPIVLRKGKTTLRAIAIGENGKISNEFEGIYKCEGSVKNSFAEKDTFEGLTLLATTRKQFEAKYGAPASTAVGNPDKLGTYTIAYYGFGHAVYLDSKGGEPNDATLAELSTTDDGMKGPRGVRVGMSLSDATALFRDEGGEDDGSGNRVLYKLTTGNQGMLTKTGEGAFIAQYHAKLTKDYIELVLYSVDEVIVKIEWTRYRV